MASTGKPKSIAPGDCNVPQAGDDGISSLNWSPTANFLVSSNWDSGVRVWEIQANPANVAAPVQAQPKAQVNHDNKSPVFDTCFSADGTTVFSCGADKAVRMWRLGETPPNNVAQQIGIHDAPVKSVGFLSASNLVVSGGWDNKLKVSRPVFLHFVFRDANECKKQKIEFCIIFQLQNRFSPICCTDEKLLSDSVLGHKKPKPSR